MAQSQTPERPWVLPRRELRHRSGGRRDELGSGKVRRALVLRGLEGASPPAAARSPGRAAGWVGRPGRRCVPCPGTRLLTTSSEVGDISALIYK